jgi:hypothetical protein
VTVVSLPGRRAAGAGPKEVTTRAGHTGRSHLGQLHARRYGHLYPEADTALRDRLDAFYVAGDPRPSRA